MVVFGRISLFNAKVQNYKTSNEAFTAKHLPAGMYNVKAQMLGYFIFRKVYKRIEALIGILFTRLFLRT